MEKETRKIQTEIRFPESAQTTDKTTINRIFSPPRLVVRGFLPVHREHLACVRARHLWMYKCFPNPFRR